MTVAAAVTAEHKGSKPCTLCSTPRDVLVRCQIDQSGKWQFVCPSKCWQQVSGGKIDGDPNHPYYRYGGMWKNKHEAVSAKKKGKKSRKKGKATTDVKPWTASRAFIVEGQTRASTASDDEEGAAASGTASSDDDGQTDAPVTRYSDVRYTRNDRVSYEGKLYICRKSHWADPQNPPEKDIHLWEDKSACLNPRSRKRMPHRPDLPPSSQSISG